MKNFRFPFFLYLLPLLFSCMQPKIGDANLGQIIVIVKDTGNDDANRDGGEPIDTGGEEDTAIEVDAGKTDGSTLDTSPNDADDIDTNDEGDTSQSDTGDITTPLVQLYFQEGSEYDFEDVTIDKTAEKTFHLGIFGTGEAGDLNATISGTGFAFKTTGGGSGTFPGIGGSCQEPITEPCTIVITYKPSQSGISTGSVEIGYFNGETTKNTSIALYGTGVTAANLVLSHTPSFDFGTVFVGYSSEEVFVVTNSGETLAKEIDVPALSSPFSKVSGWSCPSSLLPTASCMLKVRYTPTTNISSSQEIIVDYDNGKVDESVSCLLNGNGIRPAVLSINNGSDYNFGDIELNGNTDKIFTVYYTGDVPARNIYFASQSGNFSILSHTCQGTISQNCTVSIRFVPSGENLYNSLLTIDYFDTTTYKNSSINIRGNGIMSWGWVGKISGGGNRTQWYPGGISEYGTADGQYNYPRKMAGDGTALYVLDSSNNRVQKLAMNGNPLGWIGKNHYTGFMLGDTSSWGSGNGEFNWPTGIYVKGDLLAVSDGDNNRVQIFNTSGWFISKFGSYGSGDGQMSSPSGITMDNDLNIYITDRYNYRVQKWQPMGNTWNFSGWIGLAAVYTIPGQWIKYDGITPNPVFGSEAGAFKNPQGIAVNSTGMYVADTDNHRILKFNLDGNFVGWIGRIKNQGPTSGWQTLNAELSELGSSDGEFKYPEDVYITGTNLVVADAQNHRIQVFDLSGQFQSKFGTQGSGDNQMNQPWRVVVDASNYYYIVDKENHRIQKWHYSSGWIFDGWIGKTHTSGFLTGGTGSSGMANSEFNYPRGIAVDTSYFYVIDAVTNDNGRVQKFALNGNFSTSKTYSYSFVELTLNNTDLYVLGPYWWMKIMRIDKNLSGSFTAIQTDQGRGDNQIEGYPGGIDLYNDILYVSDTGSYRIQHMTTSMSYLGWIGKYQSGSNMTTSWHLGDKAISGTSNGAFYSPIDLAIHSDYLYVIDSDWSNKSIQKFSRTTGEFHERFNFPTDQPYGITIYDSFIYINFRTKVSKYDLSYFLLTYYGSSGSGDEQFSNSYGHYVDATYLFVCDSGNSRIQRWLKTNTTWSP